MRLKIANSVSQLLILNSVLLTLLTSCSIEKQISKSAKTDVLDAKALQTAHIGISIFDPAANKYLYNYQGDKYFVPASNIKIPTCYAAMKYLGDSLVGLRYFSKNDSNRIILPTGDPTFLHKDFSFQPVLRFLKNQKSQLSIEMGNWKDEPLGSGWSWNDYNEYYMAERSVFPAFGNVVYVTLRGRPVMGQYVLVFQPGYFERQNENFGIKLINSPSRQIVWTDSIPVNFILKRFKEKNQFYLAESNSIFNNQSIPYITDTLSTVLKVLQEDFQIFITPLKKSLLDSNAVKSQILKLFSNKIHSQSTDSLLKPMMHRSDNFFAEQTLLMVSNELLGVMNDEKIIDTILKTDFKDLPQKPKWADGSGLSRYNLFTPQDFVAILNKMKNEFGMERIKVILPTGGEGTISSYYKADSGYIYAKTGTLSGVVAFSGFLYTKKEKLLIFSTLVNNHQASATEVRRAIEKFLTEVRSKF